MPLYSWDSKSLKPVNFLITLEIVGCMPFSAIGCYKCWHQSATTFCRELFCGQWLKCLLSLKEKSYGRFFHLLGNILPTLLVDQNNITLQFLVTQFTQEGLAMLIPTLLLALAETGKNQSKVSTRFSETSIDVG